MNRISTRQLLIVSILTNNNSVFCLYEDTQFSEDRSVEY